MCNHREGLVNCVDIDGIFNGIFGIAFCNNNAFDMALILMDFEGSSSSLCDVFVTIRPVPSLGGLASSEACSSP